LIVPTIRQGVLTKASSELKGHGKLIDIVIPSFAVGALMATAVFLVLPEALHLIEGSHGQGGDDHSGHGHRFLQNEHEGNGDNEGVVFAKWGCGILGGFLLPAFLSLFCHGQSVHEDDGSVDSDGEDCKSCMEKDCGFVGSDNSVSVDDADEEAASVPEAPALMSDHQVVIGEVNEAISVQIKSLINYRLAIAVLVGDIFCNLADGIFIGAAFLGCSSATAISITLIALVHEVPQELADFVILTRYAGLSATTAFILNFVTGLSVCVGGLIVFASKPTDEAVGLVLAIAGGVYLSLAASESMPRVARYTESTSDKALSLFLTVLGTIPLGLVLLNHQHC
jgi:zinc transporter ZupT